MFQAKVKDVIIFKKIIDSLSSLVNEVNLEATSNGLSLQAMDSAHVSLVSLNMKEEGFEEYRCDKNTTLGLNLIDFGKVLKLAKTNDIMTISANEDNSFLTIKFDNESKFNLYIININNN
jgi:proliferating cell nuclear antigen